MTGACAIVVMAKAPQAGLAKTRLVPALGAAGAARLAERLLEATLVQAITAAVGPVEICCTPDTAHPAFTRLRQAHALSLSEQGEGDLGARMARAFARLLQGHSQVLVIGTDAPGLDAQYLRAAAAALNGHDAVFGPALDGGYTLVGLRRAAPALFDGMPWSTPTVMAETRRRLVAGGWRHAELPALADVDEPADLVHVPAAWITG